MTEPTTTQEVPPRVAEFLRENQTMTLATATPTGAPRATTLRYVSDDMKLYVWMRSSAWAAQQIEQNPLVSFAINQESAGLQGSGQARVLLSGEEVARAVELFSDKFPHGHGQLHDEHLVLPHRADEPEARGRALRRRPRRDPDVRRRRVPGRQRLQRARRAACERAGNDQRQAPAHRGRGRGDDRAPGRSGRQVRDRRRRRGRRRARERRAVRQP